MYYVYILEDKNTKSYYTGFSEDLKTRLKSHFGKTVKTTQSKENLNLIFYAAFKSKKKALEFEIYLKHGSGHAFRNKHLL